ncbi:nicotinate-nucleotide adenylyltransferase [Desulfosediminicola flagellatus]|uniref:nicotinate-nucleotide adenylyltransferase n=1 Tax=Desulfosediminicola flagellatus TaxID=2569541 RepID=UPI0010AC8713|nr:nicotinate-nucleotide adenylyltransferase [Desulfosediminicola flagellatus]
MIQKIGILGGTFDPVHKGHLQLALAALNECSLSKVLLIPAAGPPHKHSKSVTPYNHRLAMLKCATSSFKKLEVSTIEGNLPVPSYTIDTIRFLEAQNTQNVSYYFIIGIDAFADILSWKSYNQLLGKVTLLVANRRGFKKHEMIRNVAMNLGYVVDGAKWKASNAHLKDIYFLQSPLLEVSSTSIRQSIASGCCENIAGLDQAVFQYIKKHDLYAIKHNSIR